MLTGGQVLVRSLLGLGARRGFGIPGESYLPVLDALYDAPNAFDFVVCRHESGAAYMAEAHGKLTGEPGLAFVTRGPGATNASVGVHTAMQDSTPMILFVGQAGRGDLGREAFQEIDHVAMFGPVAKWSVQIESPDRIPEVLARAWVTCLTGRPGPVVIALPEDMLYDKTDAAPLTGITLPSEPAPDAGAVARAAKLLAGAARPLIIAGGGGWTATGRGDLARFVERSGLPLATAFRFHDLHDNRAPGYVGEAGVGMLPYLSKAILDADVVLALNIRFGEMTTGAYTLFDIPHPRQTVIHSHVSDRELGKILQPALAIHAGPNAMAAALAEAGIAGDWRAHRAGLRTGYEAALEAPAQPGTLDMGDVIRHLRHVLPADAILTNGAGNFSIWNNKHFDYAAGQRLLAPQSGTMGYGLPAAIAAKAEGPGRVVVCVAGDGDFQMSSAELGTAMQAGLAPIVLIVNNSSYGTIRMHQERAFPDRVSGTHIVNPDFSAIAMAYGMHGERVEHTADFAAAFDRALAAPRGAVLDLVVSVEGISPRATLSQIRGTVPR